MAFPPARSCLKKRQKKLKICDFLFQRHGPGSEEIPMKITKIVWVYLVQLSFISSQAFACGVADNAVNLRGTGQVVSGQGMVLYEFKFKDGPKWIGDDDGLFTASLLSAYCAQDLGWKVEPTAQQDSVPLACAKNDNVKTIAHQTMARFMKYRKKYDDINSPEAKAMDPAKREAYLKDLNLYEKSLKDFEKIVEKKNATNADFRKWAKEFGQLTKSKEPVYPFADSQDMAGAKKAKLTQINANLLGVFVPEHSQVDIGTMCFGPLGTPISDLLLDKISVATDVSAPGASSPGSSVRQGTAGATGQQ